MTVVALILISLAQRRLFEWVAWGEVDPDPPAWGYSPGYPHPSQAGSTQPGTCQVRQQAAVQWRADLSRWWCTPCQAPR